MLSKWDAATCQNGRPPGRLHPTAFNSCTPLSTHLRVCKAVPTHIYGCLSCLSFETLSCPSPFSPGPGPRLSRTELTKRFMLMREAIRPARPGDPPETRDIFSKIFQKFACVNRDLPCQDLPLLQQKSLEGPTAYIIIWLLYTACARLRDVSAESESSADSSGLCT